MIRKAQSVGGSGATPAPAMWSTSPIRATFTPAGTIPTVSLRSRSAAAAATAASPSREHFQRAEGPRRRAQAAAPATATPRGTSRSSTISRPTRRVPSSPRGTCRTASWRSRSAAVAATAASAFQVQDRSTRPSTPTRPAARAARAIFAGNVTVQSGGIITTGVGSLVGGAYEGAISGEGSDGILAQSIGGGGGNGGFSGAPSFSNGGAAATNSVGGMGGTGSDGKSVTVETALGSNITTYGDSAAGILAQSVGGGGGNGGFSIGAGVGTGSDAAGSSNTVGGNGSGGGLGGAVDVSNLGVSILGHSLRWPYRAVDRRGRRRRRLRCWRLLQHQRRRHDQRDRRPGERRWRRRCGDGLQLRHDHGAWLGVGRHSRAVGWRRRRQWRFRGRSRDQLERRRLDQRYRRRRWRGWGPALR